jgi:L-aminopeptidase/D-esterase-like protein
VLLASLIVPATIVDPQERIVSKRDADRIFRLSRPQWEDEAKRLVQSEGWKVQPGSNEAGTGVITFDLKTGVGLAVRPSFPDAQGPPETLVVGSYYPIGTFQRFSDRTRREMESAAGTDFGSAYSVTVAFSTTPSPAPGFDVVEVIITRARR